METVSLKSRRALWLVAIISSLPSLIGNRRGIGISWDSTDYIAVGLSMSAGRGALDVTGQPMVIRPPGLSAFVTLGDWLSLSPDLTLRIVNALSSCGALINCSCVLVCDRWRSGLESHSSH
jgi:hypothetical protein